MAGEEKKEEEMKWTLNFVAAPLWATSLHPIDIPVPRVSGHDLLELNKESVVDVLDLRTLTSSSLELNNEKRTIDKRKIFDEDL